MSIADIPMYIVYSYIYMLAFTRASFAVCLFRLFACSFHVQLVTSSCKLFLLVVHTYKYATSGVAMLVPTKRYETDCKQPFELFTFSMCPDQH